MKTLTLKKMKEVKHSVVYATVGSADIQMSVYVPKTLLSHLMFEQGSLKAGQWPEEIYQTLSLEKTQ